MIIKPSEKRTARTGDAVQAGCGKGAALFPAHMIPDSRGECKPDLPKLERLLRAEEVAKILNVSRTQAYRLMRESLPVVKFGGATVRVRLCDLEEFIASHVQGGGA